MKRIVVIGLLSCILMGCGSNTKTSEDNVESQTEISEDNVELPTENEVEYSETKDGFELYPNGGELNEIELAYCDDNGTDRVMKIQLPESYLMVGEAYIPDTVPAEKERSVSTKVSSVDNSFVYDGIGVGNDDNTVYLGVSLEKDGTKAAEKRATIEKQTSVDGIEWYGCFNDMGEGEQTISILAADVGEGYTITLMYNSYECGEEDFQKLIEELLSTITILQ